MTRIALALVSLVVASPALAESGPLIEPKIEILPGWRQADGSHMAAVRIELDEGWKTYWRAPGEAGIPPGFDWAGSDNLATVRYHWPVPEVVVSNGMTTLGYHRELVLPIEVMPMDPGADIALTGSFVLGICKDICMPLQAEAASILPAAATGDDASILAALQIRPDTAEEAQVATTLCNVEDISDGVRVTVRIDLPEVGPDEFVVVEPADRTIWVSEAMTERDGDRLTAEADLVPPSATPFELDPETLRFTILAGGRGVDIQGCDAAR